MRRFLQTLIGPLEWLYRVLRPRPPSGRDRIMW
jgi:hypothetical protein